MTRRPWLSRLWQSRACWVDFPARSSPSITIKIPRERGGIFATLSVLCMAAMGNASFYCFEPGPAGPWSSANSYEAETNAPGSPERFAAASGAVCLYFVHLEKIQDSGTQLGALDSCNPHYFHFSIDLRKIYGRSLHVLPFDFRSFSTHCCWHFPSPTTRRSNYSP